MGSPATGSVITRVHVEFASKAISRSIACARSEGSSANTAEGFRPASLEAAHSSNQQATRT